MSLPVAVKLPASKLGPATARINGKISDDGGESCEARFRWGTNELAACIYGDTDSDYFFNVCEDDDYIYAVGETYSEGQGYSDGLIVKFNKADLSIAARKVYGGADYDSFSAVCDDMNYVYTVGSTASEGQGDRDCLILKSLKVMPNGIFSTWSLVWQDSTLTLDNSALTLATSALTLANSALTLANSALTLNDSALTLATSVGMATTDWQNTLITDSTYYEDLTGLTVGIEHEYQTRAKNSEGEGAWSESAYFKFYKSPLPAGRRVGA